MVQARSRKSAMARLQIDIDEQLKTQIKVEAAKQNLNMSDIVEQALRDYFSKRSKR